MQTRPSLQEVLPKSGLVVSEKGGLSELLCKPKLLPLKSITLQKLEEMEVSRSSSSSGAAYAQEKAGGRHSICG
jgi:BBSome-interacting protein 1